MVDSGGQYLDGTTDVTRTFHYGSPTEEMIERYTDVLQVPFPPVSVTYTGGRIKMTGETPEVRSDKRKPREDR